MQEVGTKRHRETMAAFANLLDPERSVDCDVGPDSPTGTERVDRGAIYSTIERKSKGAREAQKARKLVVGAMTHPYLGPALYGMTELCQPPEGAEAPIDHLKKLMPAIGVQVAETVGLVESIRDKIGSRLPPNLETSRRRILAALAEIISFSETTEATLENDPVHDQRRIGADFLFFLVRDLYSQQDGQKIVTDITGRADLDEEEVASLNQNISAFSSSEAFVSLVDSGLVPAPLLNRVQGLLPSGVELRKAISDPRYSNLVHGAIEGILRERYYLYGALAEEITDWGKVKLGLEVMRLNIENHRRRLGPSLNLDSVGEDTTASPEARALSQFAQLVNTSRAGINGATERNACYRMDEPFLDAIEGQRLDPWFDKESDQHVVTRRLVLLSLAWPGAVFRGQRRVSQLTLETKPYHEYASVIRQYELTRQPKEFGVPALVVDAIERYQREILGEKMNLGVAGIPEGLLDQAVGKCFEILNVAYEPAVHRPMLEGVKKERGSSLDGNWPLEVIVKTALQVAEANRVFAGNQSLPDPIWTTTAAGLFEESLRPLFALLPEKRDQFFELIGTSGPIAPTELSRISTKARREISPYPPLNEENLPGMEMTPTAAEVYLELVPHFTGQEEPLWQLCQIFEDIAAKRGKVCGHRLWDLEKKRGEQGRRIVIVMGDTGTGKTECFPYLCDVFGLTYHEDTGQLVTRGIKGRNDENVHHGAVQTTADDRGVNFSNAKRLFESGETVVNLDECSSFIADASGDWKPPGWLLQEQWRQITGERGARVALVPQTDTLSVSFDDTGSVLTAEPAYFFTSAFMSLGQERLREYAKRMGWKVGEGYVHIPTDDIEAARLALKEMGFEDEFNNRVTDVVCFNDVTPEITRRTFTSETNERNPRLLFVRKLSGYLDSPTRHDFISGVIFESEAVDLLIERAHQGKGGGYRGLRRGMRQLYDYVATVYYPNRGRFDGEELRITKEMVENSLVRTVPDEVARFLKELIPRKRRKDLALF